MEHYVIKPAGEAGEAAVHAGLRAYNRTFVSDTADLSLVVEDEAGQIIGGCDAFRMGELALLDVLWVAESRRGTGLGACLLAQLEQDGLAFADRTAGRLVTEDTSVLDAVRRAQARVLIEHYYDSMAELGYARTEAAELLKEEHL